MSFNFGTTANVFGDSAHAFQVQQLATELTAAKDALAASESKLKNTRNTLHTTRSQHIELRDELATSQKKLSVTGNALAASRVQVKEMEKTIATAKKDLAANEELLNSNRALLEEKLIQVEYIKRRHERMDPDAYNHIANLQQEIQELKNQLKERRKLDEECDRKIRELEETLKSKDLDISDHERELATTRSALDTARAVIEEDKLAQKATDELLHKAYADTKTTEQKLHAVRVELDNAEAAHKETELKLQSLHTQWEDDQEKIEDYDRMKETLALMETEQTDLLNEVDNHNAQMGEKDHIINVKDARIANLEDQLQKALTTVRTAEAAAEAAKTPATEPPHIGIVGDSLQDELDELGSDGEDFEQTGSEYLFEQQTLVGIIPHATIDIAPIEPAPQKLSYADVATTMNTAPMEAPKPTLSISGISSIAIAPTAAQKQPLSISAISSIDTAPIKPAEIATKDAGVMATATLRTSGIQTVETYPVEARGTEPIVHAAASKKTAMWPIISGLLALLCVYLWLQLQAWKTANFYDGYSAGAYGRPTSVLGMWTIGGDIGDSWMSEMVTKHMAGAVYSFEEWIGADRGIVY